MLFFVSIAHDDRRQGDYLILEPDERTMNLSRQGYLVALDEVRVETSTFKPKSTRGPKADKVIVDEVPGGNAEAE